MKKIDLSSGSEAQAPAKLDLTGIKSDERPTKVDLNPDEGLTKLALDQSQMKTIKNLAHANQKSSRKPATTKSKKRRSWLPLVLGAVAAAIVVMSIIAGLGYAWASKTKLIVQAFQAQAEQTYQLAKDTYNLFKTQDIPQTRVKLQETKDSFAQTKVDFTALKPTLKQLGYSQYYQDGLTGIKAADEAFLLAEEALNIIEPYADILGFSAADNPEGSTAEDRVKKILDTLEVIGPQLDQLYTRLQTIQGYINSLDFAHYPEVLGDFKYARFGLNFLGRPDLATMPVRQKLVQAQDMVDLGITTFGEYRPVIDKLPTMMGAGGQRKKYLVIFQNNNELRPTGGFLTAYSIVYLEDGKVTPEKSDDIYELDKKFNGNIPIPTELGKYLTTERYWNLRDMNIDPDFKNSMDQFLANYKLVKGEPQDIDGIIAIDTKVLVDLVQTLGPVDIPGYGQFTAEPDSKYEAPQIIIALSEIITRPTPYLREDRKGILGPMMKAILEKTYGAGKESFAALFQIMIDDIAGRHVQAYFLDPQLQEAAEKINLAGRMIAPTDGGDFLAIVDANLGGAKSNLFIDYSVTQTILPPENGTLSKKVVINYVNSRPGDNCNLEAGLLCLNATNNDWNRLYLPLGSKLLSARGYKGEPTVYEENGFTVIDGFFALNPNSTARIDLEYEVPYSLSNYVLHLWQQGGLREVKHLLDVNDNQEEIIVKGDITYQANF